MAMTRAEPAGQGPALAPGSRVGIIAGGGSLPVEVAEGLASQGHSPFVILAEGEVDREADFAVYEQATLALEDIGSLLPVLRRQGISHLVLAGEIRRRPRLTRLRPTPGLLAMIPTVIMGLSRGDDGLLKVLTRWLERRGITVVGAHEIVPELAASQGTLTTAGPRQSDWRDIEAGRAAAKAIGALDVGQAAIAIGGRAIALEGIEGTNGLLERTRELRGHGRLAGKTRGVLVKCAKPGQELRADLPSIGPQTVEAAHAAGLAGIAVEAGRSLILEGPATLARANALGLFIVGLPATEPADGR
ncbi:MULTISPECIES: UDP-2,3-diacylglucosamine diphosphatase LpxI [unclassified Mesorhizobium]|uniref:LpxI family protein n=1 Tax=unclassified Mesorhizobium TaxID=325217 RepID=UPI001FDFFE78|nr:MULTISPECIES: UDP-2,3-diacylglucosamine diphosphatase LpxI [unclassified Mesorhizobium]